MKNYFAPLKRRDYLTLSGFIIPGFGWLLVGRIFFSKVHQRFIVEEKMIRNSI